MPTMGTATQPLDAVAVLLGGLVSVAREPVTVDVGGPIASTLATALQVTGVVMPSVAYACVRLATKVLSVSSGVAWGTLGLTVNRSANVSMGQPATMSAGPVPARPAGGEASVNMPVPLASSG